MPTMRQFKLQGEKQKVLTCLPVQLSPDALRLRLYTFDRIY